LNIHLHPPPSGVEENIGLCSFDIALLPQTREMPVTSKLEGSLIVGTLHHCC
jgi:hypothetical protein